MRYHEIVSEKIVGPKARPYPFHLQGVTVQTHEEFEGGSRLFDPIEHTRYTFDSDNGLTYRITCSLERHALDVSFAVPSETISGRTAMNGAGDAVRVIATVFAAVRDYVEQNDPRTITFSASATDRGRVALYDRFCQKGFIPGYTLTGRKPGMSVKYVMSRPLRPADMEADQREAEKRERAKAESMARIQADIDRRKAEREKRLADDEAFMKSAQARLPRQTLDQMLDDELLRDLLS